MGGLEKGSIALKAGPDQAFPAAAPAAQAGFLWFRRAIPGFRRSVPAACRLRAMMQSRQDLRLLPGSLRASGRVPLLMA